MINIQKMMQQAKLVQQKLEEVQEKLKDIEVHGQAGNGAVKVVMSGAAQVKSVSISDSLIVPGGREMLEDLIVAALGSASEAKDERVKEETKKIMESVGVDENTKFPF
jgi:DNA-binding YbaB/EbfC family protein